MYFQDNIRGHQRGYRVAFVISTLALVSMENRSTGEAPNIFMHPTFSRCVKKHKNVTEKAIFWVK